MIVLKIHENQNLLMDSLFYSCINIPEYEKAFHIFLQCFYKFEWLKDFTIQSWYSEAIKKYPESPALQKVLLPLFSAKISSICWKNNLAQKIKKVKAKNKVDQALILILMTKRIIEYYIYKSMWEMNGSPVLVADGCNFFIYN